ATLISPLEVFHKLLLSREKEISFPVFLVKKSDTSFTLQCAQVCHSSSLEIVSKVSRSAHSVASKTSESLSFEEMYRRILGCFKVFKALAIRLASSILVRSLQTKTLTLL